MRLPVWMFSALLALLPGSALAVDRAGATAVMVELQRLDIDTTMMLYDESDRAVNATLRERIKTLDAALAPVLADMKADTATGNAPAEAWRLVRLSLEGDRQNKGMLAIGYDARAYAELRTSLGELQNAVDRHYQLGSGKGTEEQALLLAARVMAVYIRTAGSPFGSFSDNNDQSIEDDLAKMSTRLDGMINTLRDKYSKDPKKAEAIKRVVTKWGFIRGTILKYTQQSTPTIVYRHGTDIIEQLAALK
ncbi:MAG: hypothetical protein ACOY3X_04745 [Pseudomonadota bacterium]